MLNAAIKAKAAATAKRLDEVVYILRDRDGELVVRREHQITRDDERFLLATVDPCGMVERF